MARAVVWNLYADPRGYTKGFRDAETTTKRFGGTVKKTAGLIGGAFAGIQVAGFLKGAIDEAREAAKVGRQTAAVIKTTGGVANVSAKDVDRLASSLSAKVGVDDEVIAAGQNMLLTFKGVRNEAGKNNDIFNQASTVALGMAAAFNQGEVSQQGLEKANIQLGKALNDPIKGITALTRVGVTFTQAQKDQIKALVESGKTMEAQKIILGELKSEFGGAAEAAADPFDQLNVSVGNLKETLGVALVPALNDAADAINNVIGDFNDLNEETDGMAAKAVLAAAGLGVLVYGVVKTTAAIKTLNETLGLSGAKLIQFGAYGAAAGEVLNVITYNLNEFKDKGLEKGHFLDPASLAIKQVGELFGVWGDKTAEQTDAQKLNTEATKAGKDAAAAYAGAVQGAANSQGDAAAKSQELTTKLQGLKEQFKAQSESVRESIEAYDGLISKSDVTAAQVVEDLNHQVTNFKQYAVDTHRLIKAGVDPKAIQELSEKGPQYIHALATGSNRQLEQYKSYWQDKNKAIKGDFAASMSAQLADLKAKIKKMQAAINALTGKTVAITGKTSLQFTETFTQKDWLNARLAAGRMAAGGMLTEGTGPTADDVLIWASKGEAVVPAKAAKDPGFQQWAANQGIPGFALGGTLGRIAATSTAYAGVGRTLDEWGTLIMAAGIKKMLGMGRPGVQAFIRSVDPLPYVWGAAGPGGYDCSGLVSAVLGKHLGNPQAGHGLRYFTTSSIHAGIAGLQPGLGGTLQIGVTPGRGHMAGRYAGLGFEAESSRTGIKIGGAASPPESFARTYHLATGGLIDSRLLSRYDIGGDPGLLTINGRPYRVGSGSDVQRVLGAVGRGGGRAGRGAANPFAVALAAALRHGSTIYEDLSWRGMGNFSDKTRFALYDHWLLGRAWKGDHWDQRQLLSFFTARGYDQGGWLRPGLTMAYNGTGRPERVLPPGQGAGTTINVTVNVSGAVGNHRDVAERLAPEVYTALKRVAQRNGKSQLAALL